MARRPLPKSGSLADAKTKNDGILKNAALFKIDNTGKIQTDIKQALFLLNPSTYEENKTSNWIPNPVPGQSHPIYQWISGGPRIVTFEALVTRDSSHFLRPKDSDLLGKFLNTLKDSALKVVGDVASSFAGINMPPITDLFPLDDSDAGNNLSISNYLNYYRSLLYPTYTEDYKLAGSPPLIVLITGDTFTNAKLSGSYSTPPVSGEYLPVWIITNLNIRITKQLSNLHPMEAFVTFTLHEYPTKSINFANFINGALPSSSGVTDLASSLSGLA